MKMEHDLVREKVDSLRVSMRVADRGQALRALTGDGSTSMGDPVDRPLRYPESHLGGTLHMCPWHTCQGTRISPDASLN